MLYLVRAAYNADGPAPYEGRNGAFTQCGPTIFLALATTCSSRAALW